MANNNRIPATVSTIAPQNQAFAPATLTPGSVPSVLDIMNMTLDAPVADGQYTASLREFLPVPGITADKLRFSLTWMIKTDTGSRTLKPQLLSTAQFLRFMEQAQLSLSITTAMTTTDLINKIMSAPITIWVTRQGIFQNIDLVPPYVKPTAAAPTPPANNTPDPF